MKERIAKLVGDNLARHLYMGTFHSIFAHILRVEAAHLGFTSNFTIYDETDSRSLIKSIVKEMQLDDKQYKPASVHNRISMAKNHLILSTDYANDRAALMRDEEERMSEVSRIYTAYQQRLLKANAMDFDDLLVLTYQLFSKHEDVRQKYASNFEYVLVDEYQDCDLAQRQAIDALFNPEKCTVIKIGDSDQAIYNSADNETPDWIPMEGFLPIQSSCRYSQEIADAIFCLRKDNSRIVSSVGNKAIKPIILLFDIEKIDRVLGGFISVLEKHQLYDNKGVYKAIGAVRKEDSAGLKIGSYWSEFDGSVKAKSEHNYWISINEICKELINGKLYLAERAVRKLLCRVFHYLSIKHPDTGKEYTMVSLKKALDEEYCDIYRPKVYELSRCDHFERETVDSAFRQLVKDLLEIKNPQLSDVFESLPEHFLEEPINGAGHIYRKEANVFIDPIRGRRIVFDTIHGVKGETHDATLYLETDRQGASDLNRILPYFGAGKAGKSNLFDYSRKLAYVGFSRPRTLLCVAMQSETYEKSKGVFDKDWEIIDLRN